MFELNDYIDKIGRELCIKDTGSFEFYRLIIICRMKYTYSSPIDLNYMANSFN